MTSAIEGDEVMNSAFARFPILYTLQQARRHLPPGLAEGLSLMKPGARWKLFVPPALAYGDRGFPEARIAPGNGIIVDILLVAVHPAQASGQPSPR